MIEKKGKKNLEGFLCGQAVWMYVRLPSPVSACLTSIADMPETTGARKRQAITKIPFVFTW